MNDELNIINVEFDYLPVINYAMQQNKVALIRQFTIENKSENPLQKVKVILTAEPDFAANSTYIIDMIPAGETVRVDSAKLNLSTNYFAQLTEKSTGHISLEIRSNGVILFKQQYPVDVLAFDQWGGISILLEMLSSFIIPNHPALVPIIKRASFILGHWTGDPSLDSYQSSNLDRPWKQMAAVYTAIYELKATYSTAPSSFEEYGQRIRLVDTVVSQKLGNCLDLSLLYASCLEAIGLHPFIIITRGHAFTGSWLVSETFPDAVVDDVTLLTKRMANGINEIALVEATCMCQGNQVDFIDAVKIASNKLAQTSDFILALDVKRSRFAGIRPLPQRILNGQQWEITENPPVFTQTNQETPQRITRYDLSNISGDIEVTKQLLWERKLLDLSLRNNLLNMRATRSNLQLISVDLDKFEDALADGAEFRILPRPTDWDHPLFDSKIQGKLDAVDPIVELIKSELKQKRLRSYLNETELNKNLLHLYRSSRLSLEENGANTLYLALGLLKWFETANSVQPRYAPILLIPVEIVRKSAAKGYVIRSREEDTMMNITLLEMLRQNFGITIKGLETLPTDDSGVDVNLIYSIIRNGIKNQKKWDVEEQAILGIFSFNKFIMWNDIHNNANKLVKNKIVSSLISGKLEWDVQTDMADAAVLERTLSPTGLVLPISADSSQMEAVYEAMNNKTFVLHGPPGTGKSQTITNIIANALYRGKRVLFVAEKMAALSVVQNRLNTIGLAPFCLELHSNKAKKSAVLSQLRITSEVVKKTSPADFAQEASRIANLRVELNEYVEGLHQQFPFGLSLYDAITNYLAIDNHIEIMFPESLLENMSKSQMREWTDAVEVLIGTGKACGHPYKHPLTNLKIRDYSSQKKDEIGNTLSVNINLLTRFKECLTSVLGLLNEGQPDLSRTRIETVSGIMKRLLAMPELTPDLLTRPRLPEVLNEQRQVLEHGKKRDKLKKELLEKYVNEIFSLNASQLLLTWNQSEDKWIGGRYMEQKKIKKQLKIYALNNSIGDEEIRDLLLQLVACHEEELFVNKYSSELSLLFGRYGKPGNEDWNIIEQIIEKTAELNSMILTYAKDITEASKIKEILSRQLSEGIESFRSVHGKLITELESLWGKVLSAEEQLMLITDTGKCAVFDDSPQWIDNAVSRLKLWNDNLDKLKDWYQWLSVCERLDKLGIIFIAEEYKSKNLPTEELLSVFNKSFYHTCINFILARKPGLELFKGQLFNDVILKFKKLMADFEELTKKELYAKLGSNIPYFTKEAAQNSEVGILQRNIKNNGRGMSIRKLFDQIPTLLNRMCPCMLMSPISVAQYIDPDAEKFDLIIFDEASQMPTYESVGAIARGNNVVIVGDPKQMPPTSFFSVNNTDEDNLEKEDLESILDDCLALSMPSKHLLWHYRSKHESLIAFSNSEYYDNKLLTFPSPDNIESKVRLVPVEGIYDKGKTRQNRAEAQAVVDEIKRRLSDKVLRKRSIGVVTFSAVQQTLVEDLLSDLFVLRPDLESVATECDEPIFIKNLENVQGDERDVILFSVGYGPDENGRVSMNFGPLNRLGGERRLNVAVSRARYEMVIYSTLRSDQIDLNRTSAVGVTGLKRFLEYAERGERIIIDSQAGLPNNISIENIIALELIKMGYNIHTNIGCSGYKIDIGVVDKENPSNYILGILCDGENYRQTKTVRDREIVQNNVLKLLGWNICRVWTMDWWENRDSVLAFLADTINNAENGNTIKPEEQESTYPEKPEILNNNFSSVATGQLPDIILDEREEAGQNSASNIIMKQDYSAVNLLPMGFPSEQFHYPEYRTHIISQIKEIVENEAPVSKSLICKKILSAWGISRMGQRIEAHFELLFKHLPYHRTRHDGLVFFWLNEEQWSEYAIYRPGSDRDAADLPPEEVANCIKQIVAEQISLPTKDLSRLAAQAFGFGRNGSNVEAAMYRGIKEAVRKGYIKIDNGRAVVI